MPDHAVGCREVLWGQEFPSPFLGALVEAMVFTRRKSLVRTESSAGTQRENRMCTRIECQLGIRISGTHRLDPCVDVVVVLFQSLVGVLHLHLVTIKPPSGDQAAIPLGPFATYASPVLEESRRRGLVLAASEALHLSGVRHRVDAGPGRLAVDGGEGIAHRADDLVVPHGCPGCHVENELDVPSLEFRGDLHDEVSLRSPDSGFNTQ